MVFLTHGTEENYKKLIVSTNVIANMATLEQNLSSIKNGTAIYKGSLESAKTLLDRMKVIYVLKNINGKEHAVLSHNYQRDANPDRDTYYEIFYGSKFPVSGGPAAFLSYYDKNQEKLLQSKKYISRASNALKHLILDEIIPMRDLEFSRKYAMSICDAAKAYQKKLQKAK